MSSSRHTNTISGDALPAPRPPRNTGKLSRLQGKTVSPSAAGSENLAAKRTEFPLLSFSFTILNIVQDGLFPICFDALVGLYFHHFSPLSM